jgi:hypothetical protein
MDCPAFGNGSLAIGEQCLPLRDAEKAVNTPKVSSDPFSIPSEETDIKKAANPASNCRCGGIKSGSRRLHAD